jgi:hypothetical protein
MREEDLINKLEKIEVPEIELQSHRRRLRMALLQSQYFQEQPGRFAALKLKIKGGIAMLRNKKALAGAVAGVIVLIVGFAVFTPFGGQSPQVLAQEIAENDPQVRLVLADNAYEVKGIEQAGDFYRVTFELPGHPEKGQGQTIVKALVDVKNAKLVKLEKGYLASLTEEQKERAIEIAKSDSRVQEFLSRGAIIDDKVASLPSFGSVEEEHLPTFAGVALRLEGEKIQEKMFVVINLTEGIVVEVQTGEQDLRVPKLLTVEEKARAREIAKADPRVQEILQSGATIIDVFPSVEEGIVDVILEQGKQSWTAKVDLAREAVLDLIPHKILELQP